MLDLNDVALFVQVVRAGSFAEASRRLGIPANTASRRLQALEQSLGVRLMQRSTRRLTLTEAGHGFFARCAEQVDALAQSARAIAEDSLVPSGKLRVAAPADFFNWFPMAWVADFLALHPKVRIEFLLDDARADLLGDAIDLAFRAGREIEPSLIARRVGQSRLALVASPAYLAARGVPDTPADLAAHDCNTLPGIADHSLWRLDGPGGVVEVPVAGRLHANTSQALLQAALAGLGISLLPSVVSAAHRRSGELTQVLPQYGMEGVGVYFVYLSRRQLPRAVSAFIDFAAARLQEFSLLDDEVAADCTIDRP